MNVSTATIQESNAAVCDVAIRETHGWRRYCSDQVTLWLKGFIYGLDGASLVRRLAEMRPAFSTDGLATLLCAIDGHYAIVATGPGWAVAAVDWVRSIPLAAARIGDRWIVDDQPERLRRLVGLGRGDIDADAALSLGMAGYTIDAATLYRGLELLVPGEFIWFTGGKARQHRYYVYRPWRLRSASGIQLETELAETTLALMERMLASLNGRPLIVPLSAGRDSRLIASAARHLGYSNVCCFAYGRPGNFEAKTSQAIAEKLGYPWTFVPATIKRQRQFFAGEDYARYLDFADSGASVPFVQDMAPLMALKARGYVPDDAVIVNGNTGDFISGNHILPELQHPVRDLEGEARWRRVTDALLHKHFSLWRSLATPSAKARIAALLRRSIERAGGMLGDPEADHGLYEYAEFQDRQSKYVIAGQRIYEFLGYEWRLPLWDNAYLRFWEGVPLAEKSEQNLYARTLRNANWGGVWEGIPVNRKTIRPLTLVPLRLMAKALHAPFGSERWHRFERRYFQYWMDATANSACVPYDLVRRDRRGARHHIAWLAELYLARHGIKLDELSQE